MEFHDPIVEEVRQTRERLLHEAGGLERYAEKLKEQQRLHPERLATKGDLAREGEKPDQIQY